MDKRLESGSRSITPANVGHAVVEQVFRSQLGIAWISTRSAVCPWLE
jgi:hypothetical protein